MSLEKEISLSEYAEKAWEYSKEFLPLQQKVLLKSEQSNFRQMMTQGL
jgi:hypothetical protein